MFLSTLISSCLFAWLATASPCTPSLNWPNGDLPKMPIQLPIGLSLSQLDTQCQSMCSIEPTCVASVLLPPNCDTSTRGAAVCYLKSQLEPQITTNCTCGSLALHSFPTVSPQGSQILQIIGDKQFVATFDSRGLLSISLPNVATAAVTLDTFAFAIDGIVFNSSTMPNPVYSQPDPQTVIFVYSTSSYTFTVKYDTLIRGDVHFPFLRKTISVLNQASNSLTIGSVSPFDVLAIDTHISSEGVTYATGDMGTYGVFSRFSDGTGLGAAATNPFLYPSIIPAYSSTGLLVHIGYHPSFIWNTTTTYDSTVRPFVADAGLIGFYILSSNSVPPAIEEDNHSTSKRYRVTQSPFISINKDWNITSTDTYAGMRFDHISFSSTISLPTNLHKHLGKDAPSSWLNYHERDFFRDLAEAHFIPAQDGYKTLTVHIPWTENDYQIDISNATQWPEYVRILTQLSKIGVNRILFAGGNSAVSTTQNCTDDWGWENVLWLNLGEQLREGYWNPTTSLVPDSVQQLIDISGALGVSAIPYIYPILGLGEGTFPNAEWLIPQDAHRNYSTLGNRAYQDYFVDLQVNFSLATNAYGSGFDYTYWIDNSMSDYSQWYGWRRILTNVRNVLGVAGKPQFVVDNRQASHTWSPWMWAAGSYAEPLQSDEQTTSWTAYVQDLHIDRTDGNRQRQMNYDYAQSKLCQQSAMPGFLHHNTDRGDNRRVDLSIRDYDFYGASYTILSAVATGGLNMVVCMIPARDEEEFLNFPESISNDNNTVSISFYKTWFDFIIKNEAYLRNTKFLPSPPAPGVIDGTYAILNTSGYIFLFNPNAEPMTTPDGLLTASFDSLDLQCKTGDIFGIDEIWPRYINTLVTVSCGNNFTISMEGKSALVLSIHPATEIEKKHHQQHQQQQQQQMKIQTKTQIANQATPIFSHHQAVIGMSHNASFTGGLLSGIINVPQAVLDQLATRRELYDVMWTSDDLAISWLAPYRLLLHIDVMRSVPSTGKITATLNGNNLPVYKSWTCRNVQAEMCFQGFFIDLTSDAIIVSNTNYSLNILLPTGLTPGAFGGVYYENIDSIYS